MIEEIKNYVVGEIKKFPKIYKVLEYNLNTLTIKCAAHFKNEIEDDFVVRILIDDNYKIHLIEDINQHSNLSISDYREKIEQDFLYFEEKVNKLINARYRI